MEDNEELVDKMYTAMRDMGWFMPMNEEEVAKSEDELGSEDLPEAPPELSDPELALRNTEDPSHERMTIYQQGRLPIDSESEVSLARAARHGGKLSDELLQQMRRDRRDAEKETLSSDS
jgi:hypothetical protein